jgi:hypothetical protein
MVIYTHQWAHFGTRYKLGAKTQKEHSEQGLGLGVSLSFSPSSL